MHGSSSFEQVLLVTGLFAATQFTVAWGARMPSAPNSAPVQPARVGQQYAKLPLSFEGDPGRASANAAFLAHGNGYELYLTGGAAVLMWCPVVQGPTERAARLFAGRLRSPATCEAIRMQLEGTTVTAAPAGEEPLPGTVNYFIGNDRAHWRTGIPTFARVRYQGAYPGIDLVYYGNQRQLEYDFVAAPGSDPRAIQLRFDAATRVRRSTTGDLVLSTSKRTVTFRKPAIYQVLDGRRVSIAGGFARVGKHTVRFRLGRYDHTKPLVIDPVLEYSTFLSGSGDANEALLGTSANAIAVDGEGNAYVTGSTLSTNFPVTTGAFQATDPGASPTIFVSKLNAAGTALIYSTYLGGNADDNASAIAVDADGDAYIAGQTASQNFPVTAGALQTTNNATAGAKITAIVTELNPTGTDLIYSTYLGGSTWDGATAITVDAAGEAYVAGQTSSTDFPVTQGAIQTTNNAAAAHTANAFVAKINPGGTALIYSTYLGGSGGPETSFGGCRSAVAATNDVLGAPLGYSEDGAFAIAVDAAGDAYVAGQAISTNFPVTQGAFQTQNDAAANQTDNAFVAKLNPAGSALIYSTYLGGSGLSKCGSDTTLSPAGDTAFALSIDGSGDAYVAGIAFSSNFPVTQGAFQATNRFSYTIGSEAYPGPTAFVTKLNPSGSSLVYSTYLGGSGGFIDETPDFEAYGGDEASGLAIDGNGDAYVTGATASLNFPVTTGAYQTANASATSSGGALYNAFVTVLNPAGSALLYSTYLGGNGTNPNVESSEQAVEYGDASSALALDGSGSVYIAGTAESATFPVTSGAFQTTIPAFTSAFIAKLALGMIVTAPGFTISGTAVTVTAGATSGNTSTISVTPSGGFTGSVTLTAAITSEPNGAVNPPTFSFGSTSPVNITSTGAGTATLTIYTAAEGGCTASNRAIPKLPRHIPDGAALALLVLIAVPRRQGWRAWLALVLLLACLTGGVSACGSSGGKSTCNAITAPTTSGTYIITGTSGTTTATGTVNLTVE